MNNKDNGLIDEEEKNDIEQIAENAINELSNGIKPHIVQNGEKIVNITHNGEGDIHTTYEVVIQKQRMEIRYLKKLLEAKDEYIRSISEDNKNLLNVKDEQIELLKGIIDTLMVKLKE